MSPPATSTSVEASTVQDGGSLVEEQVASDSVAGTAFRNFASLSREEKNLVGSPFRPRRRRTRTANKQVEIAHRSFDLRMHSLKCPSVAAGERLLARRPPPRDVCCCRVHFCFCLISDQCGNCPAKICFVRFAFFISRTW